MAVINLRISRKIYYSLTGIGTVLLKILLGSKQMNLNFMYYLGSLLPVVYTYNF